MEISSSPWSFIWLNYWTTLSPFSSRRSLSPDLSSVLGTAFCLKTNNIKLNFLNLYNWDDEASNSSQSFVIILSRKMKFLKKSMNIVDLLAIAPFYISLLLGEVNDYWYIIQNMQIFRGAWGVWGGGKDWENHTTHKDYENPEDFQTCSPFCRIAVTPDHASTGEKLPPA